MDPRANVETSVRPHREGALQNLPGETVRLYFLSASPFALTTRSMLQTMSQYTKEKGHFKRRMILSIPDI